MDRTFYATLAQKSISGESLSRQTALEILESGEIELLPLLDAAFEVRKKFTGKEVKIHIINNAQNGACPEDCHYCAQSKNSKAPIEKYRIKSDEEILAEAKEAYESGAYRYCMVFAGRGPSDARIEHLSRLIREIKSKYPVQVCVSAGLLDSQDKAQKLKDAGLDRLNHNLNTSEDNYANVCSTHTFDDRLNTLKLAQNVGLEICSGVIVGMGEQRKDIVDLAFKFRELNAPSIPVNFLIPIDGNILTAKNALTPEYCLRVLCLFRFLNPKAEVRVAAGREGHLRSMEVMSLYPANSLFMDGYLNTKGSRRTKTLRMIKDAGFTINSTRQLEELLKQESASEEDFIVEDQQAILKDLNDLRPLLPAKK
ncbi:MAG: biotin synthase BioB [Candidatus Omnitrophota bacterium]